MSQNPQETQQQSVMLPPVVSPVGVLSPNYTLPDKPPQPLQLSLWQWAGVKLA